MLSFLTRFACDPPLTFDCQDLGQDFKFELEV